MLFHMGGNPFSVFTSPRTLTNSVGLASPKVSFAWSVANCQGVIFVVGLNDNRVHPFDLDLNLAIPISLALSRVELWRIVASLGTGGFHSPRPNITLSQQRMR
jgi:hypothetical protein